MDSNGVREKETVMSKVQTVNFRNKSSHDVLMSVKKLRDSCGAGGSDVTYHQNEFHGVFKEGCES